MSKPILVLWLFTADRISELNWVSKEDTKHLTLMDSVEEVAFIIVSNRFDRVQFTQVLSHVNNLLIFYDNSVIKRAIGANLQDNVAGELLQSIELAIQEELG